MKQQLLKKPLALFITFAMIFSSLGGLTTAVYADNQKPVKFSVEIESVASDGTKGVVKGEVYSDYSGKLTVTGDKVNAGNATVTVSMTDVASLGVSGTRSYTREMKFNTGRDVSMSHVTDLFDKLDKTSVSLSYGEGNSVNYKVSKTAVAGEYTLVPEGNAAAVWHAIVNDDNFEYGTQDPEDSYIVIGRGSWLKAGNSVLEFEENYENDLILDNFGDLSALDQNIRNAVTLKTSEVTEEGVSFNLVKGTKIALGSSYAQLKGNASFDFGVENYQALEQCLKDLRDLSGENTEQLMIGLFGIIDTAFEAVKGTEIAATGTIDPVPDSKDPDKQSLIDLVKAAIDKMNESTYTAETFKEFVDSINKAIDVIADKEATQEEIDSAKEDLQKKFDGLTPVAPEEKPSVKPGKKTVTVNVKTVNAKALNAAVKKAGSSSKYVTKVILGKKVRKVKKNTFKNYKKVTTVEVKSKKLKKSSIKGALKSSKVKTIKVKVGKKKVNKKYIKKYKKIFTKKIAGRKVKVK